jgi:hypothetical protein
MKVATWIGGAGALFVIVLIVILKSGDRAGNALKPSAEEPARLHPIGAPGDAGGGAGQGDNAGMMLSEPDRDLNEASAAAATTEEPPRTTAGIIPVKQSMEMPIVDPATLPYDTNIGRIENSSAPPPPNSGPGEAYDPMLAPGDRAVETNDGPLAGRVASPDSTAPGPAGPSVSGSTSIPNDSNPGGVLDPLGPGQPIDPAAAPPNYVLPGAGVTIEDPDSSPGAPDTGDSY